MYWRDFIDWLAPSAQIACSKYDLPASVLIAQGAHESGWGESAIGEFNLFGRKWGGWGEYIDVATWEVEDGEVVNIVAKFQDYDSLEQACEDWCILITEEPCYIPALETWRNTRDVDQFVEVLGPIYATDPEYSKKILDTINDSDCNLKQYDC